MGMLIRRHRDRHKTEATAESEGGPTRAQLKDEAKALGLSTRGNKAELAGRIAAHQSGAAPDVEADKVPDTETDPGAGGDNPDAPAPEDGTDLDTEADAEAPDADQLTESGSDSE